MKITLTIAGSDSGGGAGLQADIKTMQSLGVYATCVVTCTTAQNSLGISELINLPSKHIKNQLEKVLNDFKVDVVKIGVIGGLENPKIIADILQKYKIKNIILDPVMACKNTKIFLNSETQEQLIKYLFPLANLITPNLAEVSHLSGISYAELNCKDKLIEAYNKMKLLGCKNILIKAGQLDKNPMDILFYNDKVYEFKKDKIKTLNTHGTGCTLSSAIASFLALGNDLVTSVRLAKNYVYQCIKKGCGFKTKGPGPIGHHCLKN